MVNRALSSNRRIRKPRWALLVYDSRNELAWSACFNPTAKRGPIENKDRERLSLQQPFAAGREQSQPSPDQEAQREKQAPERKEEQGQDAGVLGLCLQQPFDDPDRSEETNGASGQAGDHNDKLPRGHRLIRQSRCAN